jgi:hypothetical protein
MKLESQLIKKIISYLRDYFLGASISLEVQDSISKIIKKLETLKELQTRTFLYDKEGNVLGFYELIEKWNSVYPQDIFVNSPEPVIKIREGLNEILELKRKSESES